MAKLKIGPNPTEVYAVGSFDENDDFYVDQNVETGRYRLYLSLEQAKKYAKANKMTIMVYRRDFDED